MQKKKYANIHFVIFFVIYNETKKNIVNKAKLNDKIHDYVIGDIHNTYLILLYFN